MSLILDDNHDIPDRASIISTNNKLMTQQLPPFKLCKRLSDISVKRGVISGLETPNECAKIAVVPTCYLGAMSQILQIHTRDQEIPSTATEMPDPTGDKVEVQMEDEVGS